MKSVGIICEYNPFHNGHLYHIKKVKELYPDYVVIAVINGNFTQRGDISLIDKWKKADIALNYHTKHNLCYNCFHMHDFNCYIRVWNFIKESKKVNHF